MGSSSRPGPQRSRLDFSQTRGFVVGATRRVMPYAEPDVQGGVSDAQPLSRLSRIRSSPIECTFAVVGGPSKVLVDVLSEVRVRVSRQFLEKGIGQVGEFPGVERDARLPQGEPDEVTVKEEVGAMGEVGRETRLAESSQYRLHEGQPPWSTRRRRNRYWPPKGW